MLRTNRDKYGDWVPAVATARRAASKAARRKERWIAVYVHRAKDGQAHNPLRDPRRAVRAKWRALFGTTLSSRQLRKQLRADRDGT